MKKYQFLFMALAAIVSLNAQSYKGQRIYLPKGADNGVFVASVISYNPGDTLVVRAALNPWSYIYFGGMMGTASLPVVVINEGGQVQLTTGFDVDNTQYLKITGTGSKDKYGFLIQHSSGTALTIHDKSAHIAVDHFYASDCAFGCWIKNEANCDTTINNWVLDDMIVHDYELHNMRIEGFYMGSTDPNNAGRPITCDGVQQYYRPSKLGNIKVYNGIIDGTGRPAIMLSNAQIGMSEIYNNTVSHVGREYNDQQGTGISLGLYTRAYVHNNKVNYTYTWGIASLGGSGLIRIESNTIDNSGNLDGKKIAWAQNVMVDTRPTDPVDSTRFVISNNKLNHPGAGAENIHVWLSYPTYYSTGNIICNNITGNKPATVRVEPGIYWSDCNGVQYVTDVNFSYLFMIGNGAIL